ncbi:MAG: hypothetical protein E7774_01675 [Bradyrhizobium sp.]|nr:MAG: hypothetical protein E7774_01675 [Bradyrhizobium sp.]
MMFSRIALGLFGLIHLANGLFMVVDAHDWYWAVPGVPATGPMNHHFIVDIGLVFVASGAGMLMGLRAGAAAAAFALAGSVWPGLHACFHIFQWLAEGFPREPRVAAAEVLGVVLIGYCGLALAYGRARREGVL